MGDARIVHSPYWIQLCAEWHKSTLNALVNFKKKQKNKTIKTIFVPVYLVAVTEHRLHIFIPTSTNNNTITQCAVALAISIVMHNAHCSWTYSTRQHKAEAQQVFIPDFTFFFFFFFSLVLIQRFDILILFGARIMFHEFIVLLCNGAHRCKMCTYIIRCLANHCEANCTAFGSSILLCSMFMGAMNTRWISNKYAFFLTSYSHCWHFQFHQWRISFVFACVKIINFK